MTQTLEAFVGNRSDAYRYALDQTQLDSINDYIAELIELHVMRGDRGDSIILAQTVNAYQAATAAAVTNIMTQSVVQTRNVEQTLMSEPYRRRIAYLRARVFEEMRGFSDQTRTDLARALADGIASGLNPREIATQIRDRLGVAHSRALRIARTEINNGHRRAIWDEDQQTQEEGIKTRLMHVSALLATTRRSHASRHGKVYSRQEVEEWYSRDGNAINCRCTQVSVLTNDAGEPLSDNLPVKLRKQASEYLED